MIINALESPNLEVYTEALYTTRSHLIDVLVKLEPEKINALEQAFHNKQLKLPTKFANFFQIVRIHQNADEDKKIFALYELHETYESYRVCAHSDKNDNRVLEVKHSLLDVIRHFGFWQGEPEEEVLLPDSATYALIEREYSREATPKNKAVLHALHICQGSHRIVNGLFDKCIESFSKAAQNETKKSMGLLIIPKAIASSEIDSKSAEKLFTILEKHWTGRFKDGKSLLLRAYGLKLEAYAKRGFLELKVALIKTIELLNTIDTVEAKYEAIYDLGQVLSRLRSVPDNAEKEIVNMRLLNAILAVKNSNTKTELLGALFAHRFMGAWKDGQHSE